MCSANLWAHSDFWKTKTFGNVKVRILTGFDYEEINKVWIIGELASKLCHSLGYKDTVFFDFNHHYTADCYTDYFVSFDQGNIIEGYDQTNSEPILKHKSLVLREISRTFDACISLNLLEYAIKNLKMIQARQSLLTYNKNFCNWKVNTIDTAIIRQASNAPVSALLNTILKARIDRPSSEDSSAADNLSYFFKENKYHVYSKANYLNSDEPNETVLLVTNNIYQFTKLSPHEAVVFDTDGTFYYVQGSTYSSASKRHTIENHESFYEPYTVTKLGWDKVAISFWRSNTDQASGYKESIALLNIKKDEVLQDLDKVLERSK